mmetsp:Transcript_89073/g.288040  ORF Transcript_89073/g.288040 Transcript_89073/m.288040 type:complete len:236 (-) Transcript_89073:64-771(-)
MLPLFSGRHASPQVAVAQSLLLPRFHQQVQPAIFVVHLLRQPDYLDLSLCTPASDETLDCNDLVEVRGRQAQGELGGPQAGVTSSHCSLQLLQSLFTSSQHNPLYPNTLVQRSHFNLPLSKVIIPCVVRRFQGRNGCICILHLRALRHVGFHGILEQWQREQKRAPQWQPGARRRRWALVPEPLSNLLLLVNLPVHGHHGFLHLVARDRAGEALGDRYEPRRLRAHTLFDAKVAS